MILIFIFAFFFFFFNDTPTTEIYTLSLHDALPIYDGSLQTYGAPRVQLDLRDDYYVHVGRKRVARLMRDLEIEGVSRRGKKRHTTIPDPKQPPAPDLVKRKFEAERPNALWLADITYVPTHQGY